jgi:hypothetical protein
MTNVGTANTVAELIAILEKEPPETPVRTASLSHTWPVAVERHERCILLSFG